MINPTALFVSSLFLRCKATRGVPGQGGHLGSADQEPLILATRLWRHPKARAGTLQVRPHGGKNGGNAPPRTQGVLLGLAEPYLAC
jgi:hypothetical protein